MEGDMTMLMVSFAFWTTERFALRTGALIITTVWINEPQTPPHPPFFPTHLLNHTDITDIYLHSIWELGYKNV